MKLLNRILASDTLLGAVSAGAIFVLLIAVMILGGVRLAAAAAPPAVDHYATARAHVRCWELSTSAMVGHAHARAGLIAMRQSVAELSPGIVDSLLYVTGLRRGELAAYLFGLDAANRRADVRDELARTLRDRYTTELADEEKRRLYHRENCGLLIGGRS